ncbi:aldose 1-epimerase family protein [Labedaea rhizosphaerae]|uniref:Aldose 1-epimerase n=1 Tax=Labedaea rhizosphaerae TaxID=598644 RepID=A0A4R6SKQ4_LABRH|nr:aldose 1-epimerase family protein [Labedaea rhizosphaerae]TDQ04507.1 aldose 1-epimerase [Labedaea rhizosphaerae]
MALPTGEQLEISGDGHRAVVTTVGAGLRVFERGGVPYLETFPAEEKPPLGAGCVLVPWPNRVAGASWQGHQLEVTEPARGNAIHGLVRRDPWTVSDRGDSHVELEITVDGAPGWPFRFRTTIRYSLDANGLTVRHGVHNLGDADMPFGVGVHPYPRPGATDVDECVLSLAATTRLPLDADSMIPNGDPVSLADKDIVLKTADLDTPFGGCEPGADGLIRHALRGPDGGVQVWADPDFRWVQVFTPPEFPGRPGRAVAIEPMTCPPDALNSGVDVLTVAPGADWHGRWGLTPLE